jgi:DNA-directed RNA polymerase subunit RPC12/RpoP
MKTTLLALLITTLAFIMFTACASEKQQQSPVQVEDSSNRFRTINANNSSNNSRVGSQTVVCHNCRAQFKLSSQIQKMSMKGDAIVDCPVCHHNYLKKAEEQ